jgi:hypothetical protein
MHTHTHAHTHTHTRLMPLYYRGPARVRRRSFQTFNYSCGYANNKLCITHFKTTQTCLIYTHVHICIIIYNDVYALIYIVSYPRRARFVCVEAPGPRYRNNNIIITRSPIREHI